MRSFRLTRVAFIVAFAAAWLLGSISLASAQNITLVGSYKPTQANSGYGDVWGDGNLAFMGSWTAYSTYGVGIFDISNPATPNLLTVYNFSTDTGNQFEQGVLRSNLLYIGSWGNGNNGGSGVHILSLTNPSSPRLLSRITQDRSQTFTGGFNDVHTLFLERNFLYMAAHESSGILSVKVFDVSDPTAPFYVNTITTTNTTKVHQITTGLKGTNTILYTSGWGVASSGTMGQTDIWDVSSIATNHPADWLGRIYSGYSSHSSWPTPDGNTLIVCREQAGGEVSFYDITTPPQPNATTNRNPLPFFVITPASMGIEQDIPHNPVVVGNLLFLSWYQNGLQIFDITDKTKPVRIGSYDTYSLAASSSFQGNWGIYPHLGLNKLLVSDINNGFFVLDASAVLTATNNYPPLLIKSPVSQTVTQGMTATFDAVVTGSAMKYRWFFNSSPIAGATNSTLIISNVLSANSGSYKFIASNTLQSVTRAVTSSIATLSVAGAGAPPQITSQPPNTSVYAGQSATLSVAVTGSAPFSYQWLFNGSVIAGATNNPFTLQNIEGEMVGKYSVIVSNTYGVTASSNASLAIIDSPYMSGIVPFPGAHGALITWNTTVPSDSQVQFDPSTATNQTQFDAFSGSATFSQASYTDSRLTTNHSIQLSGLTPGTKYNFQVVSKDATNTYISGVYSFSTAGELIVDNPAASLSSGWTNGTSSVDKYLTNYTFTGAVSGNATATATFAPVILTPGKYDVYVWYPQGNNRCTNTPYTINYSGGSLTVRVNQQTNGGGWRLIGSALPFAAGASGNVRIGNNASPLGSVVLADAVRFVYVDSQDFPTDGSIPAWWSTAFFGSTSVDPNADNDGDGYSNSQEYILGTSPIAMDDKFGVNVFRSGDSLNVIFSPYLGDRSYQLVHSSDVAGPWSPAPTSSITADANGDGVVSVSTSGGMQDFYRVTVQLGVTAGRSAQYQAFSGSVPLTAETAVSPYATDPVCGPNRAYLRARPGLPPAAERTALR